MPESFDSNDLSSFFNAAASLKLYSRAELSDDKDRSLIEKLYVDPLPNEQAFRTLVSETTTLLVGRKGTGKSTIFQRAQQHIRKNKTNSISSYMDIRNVYESSQADTALLEKVEASDFALPAQEIRRLLIHNGFIKALIAGLRDDLKKQMQQNFMRRIRERVAGTVQEIFEGLDKVVVRLSNPTFENVSGLIKANRADKENKSVKDHVGGSVETKVDTLGISGSGKAEVSIDGEVGQEDSREFTEILMRIIGVNEIIDEIRRLLEATGITYLYVFLDDFSELPEDAMRAIVDAVISPFTRWSSFIKFKIAAYPGRIYLGDLDKTKIEEFHLDLYNLYGSGDVFTMEERAIEFTQRLVERRMSHYCKADIPKFFEEGRSDLWRIVFYASLGNPRILGHILLYAYESNLLYGKRIGVRAINEAAQRYYEEKVASYFVAAQFKNSFHERSSAFSLKELLETVVNKARKLKTYKGSQALSSLAGRPPTSHFYVSTTFDDLLTSLELGFFITKYYEQSDRDGARVSVYALNFGLCEKYQIGFGRPTGSRENRLYFVERVFDYNSIVRTYMAHNQEVRCEACGTAFELEMLPMLRRFRMKCPDCVSGYCSVTNLSQKYKEKIDAANANLLLPDTELGILQTLKTEGRGMFAAEIAEDLDCSGQLVGRRAKNLSDKELVLREQVGPVKRYQLTEDAQSAYFSDYEVAELDIDDVS